MLRPWELQISTDAGSGEAVYVQIADAIIDAIKKGKLHSGYALPGTRQLSQQLKVNRNTIVRALDILLAEGWLVSKERKGVFVPEDLPQVRPAKQASPKRQRQKITQPRPSIVFDDGVPDSRNAPINELARAYRQIFSRQGRWQMMGYCEDAGSPEFREAIVQMLNYKRALQLSADEVFITRGSQMAMYLSARCLLDKGDIVAVEHPGYKPAWKAFEDAGAWLLPVSVDADGLVTDELRFYLRRYKKIRAVYITPHHQFPTTVTLSLARRLELVELSNTYGFTIIEDDYDNEFHFGQRPVLPVCSLENVQHYIYIGTMSKIVAPALRIGYLASPKQFIDKVRELRRIIDVQGDTIMEQAVLELIRNGEIKRHLKRATAAYKAKRDFFWKVIQEHMGEKVEFSKPDGGLAFWLMPRKKTDVLKLSVALLKRGVQILPPEKFSYHEPVNGLRLGYASLTEEQLEEGAKIIAELL